MAAGVLRTDPGAASRSARPCRSSSSFKMDIFELIALFTSKSIGYRQAAQH